MEFVLINWLLNSKAEKGKYMKYFHWYFEWTFNLETSSYLLSGCTGVALLFVLHYLHNLWVELWQEDFTIKKHKTKHGQHLSAKEDHPMFRFVGLLKLTKHKNLQCFSEGWCVYFHLPLVHEKDIEIGLLLLKLAGDKFHAHVLQCWSETVGNEVIIN